MDSGFVDFNYGDCLCFGLGICSALKLLCPVVLLFMLFGGVFICLPSWVFNLTYGLVFLVVAGFYFDGFCGI